MALRINWPKRQIVTCVYIPRTQSTGKTGKVGSWENVSPQLGAWGTVGKRKCAAFFKHLYFCPWVTRMSANRTSLWGHSNTTTHMLLFPSLVLLGCAAASAKPHPFWYSPRVVMRRQKSAPIPLLQCPLSKSPLRQVSWPCHSCPWPQTLRPTLRERPHDTQIPKHEQLVRQGSHHPSSKWSLLFCCLPPLLPKIPFTYSQSQTNSNRWPCPSQATKPSRAQAGLGSVQRHGE